MKLFYYKDPIGNFGDELNAWLWPQLLPELLGDDSGNDEDTLFVGIGSILDKRIPQGPNKIVFGTGVGYGLLPVLDERWKICCVRGPLTAEALGLPPDLAITDPAVLVNTLRTPPNTKTYRASFIPHFRSPARACDQRIELAEICTRLDINYIDPSADVVEVLRGIERSELVLCEAMHGAIVADALRVPWVPLRLYDQVLELKWWDWCGSLGLEYAPLALRGGSPPTMQDITAILEAALRKGNRTLSSDKAIEVATACLQERLAALREDRTASTCVTGSAEFVPNPEVLKGSPWLYQMQLMLKDIAAVVPTGASFILVDENRWGGGECIAGRHTIPFMERDREYWGLPPDDTTAIAELERLRDWGAAFIAFAWPSFWWLDFYGGLAQHLRSEYKLVLGNERVEVFALSDTRQKIT